MKKLVALVLLASAAVAQVKLPPFTKRTLANGVTLILSPKHDVPMLSIVATVRGGDEADPAGQAGLGTLMMDLLERGTSTRPAEQFAADLDFLGATWRAQSNEQAFEIGVEALSSFAPKVIELLADATLRPAFPEEQFAKARAQGIARAKAAKDNPQVAIRRYFQSFFYGPRHPYGKVVDDVTLANISRDAIVAHHKKMFSGANLTLTVVGDFEAAELNPRIEKAFGSLDRGSQYQWVKNVEPPNHESARLLLVDKPDSTQTYFLISQPGISRTHPDRVPLQVVNTLFGGRFTSMLNDALRVNSGLTYGANSGVEENRLTGAITISTYTKVETTVEAMDLALEILNRLREKGLDAEALQSAKNYIKGIYPTRALETNGQIARVLSDLDLYGLNRGEIDDYFSRIDALTVEKANEVARKYYRAGNLQFTLVGPAAKIEEKVAKYAPKRKVKPIAEPGFTVDEF